MVALYISGSRASMGVPATVEVLLLLLVAVVFVLTLEVLVVVFELAVGACWHALASKANVTSNAVEK
jgi:hypothetical protein